MNERPKSQIYGPWRVTYLRCPAKGDIEVEVRKINGAFQYRLSYLYSNENGSPKHSKWFPDLEQALASSMWKWWQGYMPAVMPVGPYMLEELRRIIKTSPAVKSYVENHPNSMYEIMRFERMIEDIANYKEMYLNQCNLMELRWAWAPDPVPLLLWSERDEALGMTEEEKAIVIAKRQADWDYPGHEPPESQAIIDKYLNVHGGAKKHTARNPENEVETVIVLGVEGGSLGVQRMGDCGAFKYRFHVCDCAADFLVDEDIPGHTPEKHSKWFPSLEQALNSSRYEWWEYSPFEVALDLEDELQRIAEPFPEFRNRIQSGIQRRKLKVAKDCVKLAKNYIQQGNIEGAISEYTRAIGYRPYSPGPYKDRGLALQDIGELDRAIADYDMAVKYSNGADSVVFFRRAGAYHRKGEFDRAIDDYSMAIKLDADLAAMPLINRGNVYDDMGDYSSAIADYTEAIRLGCNAPNGNTIIARAHHNRGLAYRTLEDSDSAIEDFTQSIWLDPSVPGSFLDRGNAYFDIDDYDRAVSDYTHAIQLDPSHHKAFHNRGCVYAEMGDFDKAFADFDEAIRLMPNNANVHLHHGMAHREMGNHDLAIVSFGKAIELDPNLGMAWHNRGLAYQKVGDAASASSDFAVASKLGYYSQS